MNTEPTNQPIETGSNRRCGNIARLPKATRDKINQMLDDGIEYSEIITALGEQGQHLQPSNFTHWKNGGYQDYLRNQAWRDRMSADADRLLEVAEDDPTKLVTGGLYATAIQICKLMDELTSAKAGETDAEKCARVTNSLSRLSRSVLQLQQYRDKSGRNKEPKEPMRGGVTREELKRITERMRL
jgi:hypothetical protein